ncbi:CopM family metallochaperone [Vreelandella olivaria]|uniref:CopM family metallochaperone n=1 Tax=Vreelandella olivaria TaxID=390919 RepID=UPI00201F5239|nr:DUF305 domain-containing protein [Halomonas olivaria]
MQFYRSYQRLCPFFQLTASVLVVAGLLVAPSIQAQQHQAASHGDHSASDHLHEEQPAVAAYKAANARMHEDMSMSFTGDPDADFAKGMIPHHEGAIAMAEIVLEYGEDEEIRQLAEEIIAAQESEIAFLREWLTKHGH